MVVVVIYIPHVNLMLVCLQWWGEEGSTQMAIDL
jgi:hypothetical protein